jgi:two-component system, OmpR family, alkaline phosphatase synthesis response regulator PhoP
VSDGGAARPAELVCVPAVDVALADGARRAGLRACGEPDAARAATAVVERAGEVAAVVVDATTTTLSDAMATCKVLRRLDPGFEPIVVVVATVQLAELAMRDELYDDFVVAPVAPEELAARLRHLAALRRTALGVEVIEHGELTLNLETYQATVAGRALDLTYMEYELLRFFSTNPGRVLTRETLLSRVWGYEYYGGARTVDVHVRRLRAKLGEEHAHLIHTVRSVGYRFG